MNEFQKGLHEGLLEELSVYADLGAPPVGRLTGALASIGEAMGKLKSYVTENPFAAQADEITFFKVVKPAFLAEKYYAMEIYHIESTRPVSDAATLNVFYEQELRYVQRFFGQHKFLYAYYQGQMTELDKLLFVRGARPVDIPLPDAPDAEDRFSTAGDQLFAKFRAFERLQAYLLHQLNPVAAPIEVLTNLLVKWPGEQTDLIELGYALYAWLRLRKGKVTAAQLMSWLELSFGVKVGRPHQRLGEIKLRKITSRTKFLDELREALEGYMDEGDAWKEA